MKPSLICGQDKYGNLMFQEHDEEAELDPIEEARVRAATEYAIPEFCPGCQTPLTEANRIANSLARCANEDCEQMVYLEPPPEPKLTRLRG